MPGELYYLKRDSADKRRPIVIMSREELNRGYTVLAIPCSASHVEKKRKRQSCAFFQKGEGGLRFDSVAMADKIALVEKSEILLSGGPIGMFNDNQMQRIFAALQWSIKM